MKSLFFAVVLVIITNVFLVDAQQECVPPLSNTSLPSECERSVMAIIGISTNTAGSGVFPNATDPDALPNIRDPNVLMDIDSELDNFCMPQCIQPFVEYYTCLGEIDYANIFDGFFCGRYNNQSCVQLWSSVFNPNQTDGIDYLAITQNCHNPLMCNNICSTELNKAVDTFGCCLAGVVEFTVCGPLEKVRFKECSIQIPSICTGVANIPTTPAPVIPTAGTNCVHPLDDTDYPAECESSLVAVEGIAINVSSQGLTAVVLPPAENATDNATVFDRFCTPECVGPLVEYYSCTGEPDYANAINGFFCGRDGNESCVVALPQKFQVPGGLAFADLRTINRECNSPFECSPECMSALTAAKDAFGCCLAGVVEFTVCGPLEQVRFDACGIDVGRVCPGTYLLENASSEENGSSEENDTNVDPTEESDVSGVVITLPFSLTLLGTVAILTFKLA